MSRGTFVSGRLKVQVKFNDRTDKYRVRLCPVPSARSFNEYGRKGFPCETQNVGLPKSGVKNAHGKRLAVDDPRALRQAARAGISFSSDWIRDFADWRGNQPDVRPPRRAKRRK